MTIRTQFLRLADRLRSLPAATQWTGSPGFDIRQVTVIVRSRTWSSGKIQTGTPTVADLLLTPTPHVIGVVGDPVLKVGPITPAYTLGSTSGGYTPEQLNPPAAPGFEWFYLCIAPDGVQRPYKLMRLTTPQPLRYMLELTAIDRVVPF